MSDLEAMAYATAAKRARQRTQVISQAVFKCLLLQELHGKVFTSDDMGAQLLERTRRQIAQDLGIAI